MNFKQFETLCHSFLSRVEQAATTIGLSLPAHWPIDHICYRVESEEGYQRMRIVFATMGVELVESMVGGRLISTYKLSQPIRWQGYSIPLVELPAPKKGKVVSEGLEHIEMVCDCSFDDIKARIPLGRFDEKGLLKPYNKELELMLGHGVAIKFHHQSLEDVIAAEESGLRK